MFADDCRINSEKGRGNVGKRWFGAYLRKKYIIWIRKQDLSGKNKKKLDRNKKRKNWNRKKTYTDYPLYRPV